MTTNNDFIEIYDNSISPLLCSDLVSWFDLCSVNNFTVHNMKPETSQREGVTRKSDEAIAIPNIPVSSLSLPFELCNLFWEVLQHCLMDYAEKYDLGKIQFSCYLFKIHKVKEGQGYHEWHYEDVDTQGLRRALAWMTYLKVPEEGGETEFLWQKRRIEPVLGRTLIWPAYFTHLHRGNPPLKGEKHYITGWFESGIGFTPTGE